MGSGGGKEGGGGAGGVASRRLRGCGGFGLSGSASSPFGNGRVSGKAGLLRFRCCCVFWGWWPLKLYLGV